jgi:hypothetical protein
LRRRRYPRRHFFFNGRLVRGLGLPGSFGGRRLRHFGAFRLGSRLFDHRGCGAI